MREFAFDKKHGLDHVALCVRDLPLAEGTLKSLGFQIYPGGKHEEYGTQNSGAWFDDDTYIELLTCSDPFKASWLDDFLKNQEGAFFLVLKVPSVVETASLLGQRGFEIGDPVPGMYKQEGDEHSSELWRSLFLPRNSLPGRTLFFIEYTENEQLSRSNAKHPVHFASHPNSAKKLSSVWIAVEDLDRAAQEFQDLGFQVGPRTRFEKMQAFKRVIQVGRGTIELISPIDAESPAAKFLKERGEGVFGFCIEVEKIFAVKEFLPNDVLKISEEDENGKCVLIPPTVAHGAWIQLSSEKDSLH